MTKHTPGPWATSKAVYGALRVGPALLAHPGREMAERAAARGHDMLAQHAADARLIAAAPDMLAALKLAAQNITDRTAERAILAAITKAQGEG